MPFWSLKFIIIGVFIIIAFKLRKRNFNVQYLKGIFYDVLSFLIYISIFSNFDNLFSYTIHKSKVT